MPLITSFHFSQFLISLSSRNGKIWCRGFGTRFVARRHLIFSYGHCSLASTHLQQVDVAVESVPPLAFALASRTVSGTLRGEDGYKDLKNVLWTGCVLCAMLTAQFCTKSREPPEEFSATHVVFADSLEVVNLCLPQKVSFLFPLLCLRSGPDIDEGHPQIYPSHSYHLYIFTKPSLVSLPLPFLSSPLLSFPLVFVDLSLSLFPSSRPVPKHSNLSFEFLLRARWRRSSSSHA